MKNLEEFLAAYVREYGSVKVTVGGDGSYTSTSGVTEVAANEADVYIVNNAEIDGKIANGVETVVYSSTSKINYRPQHQPNAGMVNTKHSEIFIFDNFAVFSTNNQLAELKQESEEAELSEQVGTTLTPEQTETIQVEELDTREPETVEELPEGFPFSIAGAETKEELDSVDILTEEDEEGDEPKRVW